MTTEDEVKEDKINEMLLEVLTIYKLRIRWIKCHKCDSQRKVVNDWIVERCRLCSDRPYGAKQQTKKEWTRIKSILKTAEKEKRE